MTIGLRQTQKMRRTAQCATVSHALRSRADTSDAPCAHARAWAAVPKVDVANDSITCNTVIATAKFKPPLVFGGGATATAIALKGTVQGCTVSGANPATVLSGKFSGTLVGATNDCSFVLSSSTPQVGTLTFTWKADKTTPLLQTKSTVSVTTVSGTTTTLGGAVGGATFFQLVLGTSGVSGAFTGGDGGASSSNVFISSEDLFGSATQQCNSSNGMKIIHLGLGTITLS